MEPKKIIKQIIPKIFDDAMQDMKNINSDSFNSLKELVMENPKNKYVPMYSIGNSPSEQDPLYQEKCENYIKEIIKELAQGKNSANKLIKKFLQQNGIMSSDFELTDKLKINITNTGIASSKTDKNGTYIINFSKDLFNRDNKGCNKENLCVYTAHETTHFIINEEAKTLDKSLIGITGNECEAICDVIALSATKGIGLKIDSKKQENEKGFGENLHNELNLAIERGYITKEQARGHLENLPYPSLDKLAQAIDLVDQTIPLSNIKTQLPEPQEISAQIKQEKINNLRKNPKSTLNTNNQNLKTFRKKER